MKMTCTNSKIAGFRAQTFS